jgi:hypothetical protein
MPAKIVLFCLSAKFSPQNINKKNELLDKSKMLEGGF